MQRLFSAFPAFPAGRPGLGLLLLRAAAGLALAAQGAAGLADRSAVARQWAAAAAAVATGALLVAGLLTPLAGGLAGAMTGADAAGAALGWLPPRVPALCEPATLLVGVMAVALCLLGPGAFSLDARWFGRREVVIPPPPG
jgi:uncharacterized membrane protein YphA (DoxX/SURF4 family)